MKIISYIVAFIVLIITSTACEKVVEVKLKNTDPQIVIEAQLQAGTNDFIVHVSKSGPYFENKSLVTIEDATVTIADDVGFSKVLRYSGNGQYSAEVSAGTNKTYKLTVLADGKTYEATSFLPEVIKVDTIYSEFRKVFGPDGFYVVYLKYQDPVGVRNFFRLRYSVNDTLQNSAEDLVLDNDNLGDGNQARVGFSSEDIEVGDIVQVEFIHFDEASFLYLNTLNHILGSSGGPNSGIAAPGNPISNWSGDALGYFSAFSSDTTSLVILPSEE